MPFYRNGWRKGNDSSYASEREESSNRRESSLNQTQQLQSQNDETQEQGAKLNTP